MLGTIGQFVELFIRKNACIPELTRPKSVAAMA